MTGVIILSEYNINYVIYYSNDINLQYALIKTYIFNHTCQIKINISSTSLTAV